MAFTTTARAGFVAGLLHAQAVEDLGREHPGGHGENRVAENHHQRRDELPQRRDGRDVAITHRRQRHHAPVERLGDGGEAGLGRLDQIDQSAEHRDDAEHGDEEQQDLAPAARHGLDQHAALADEGHQAQHAEQTQHAQYAHHQQGLGARYQKRQPGRRDRQQVEHAVEALGPGAGMLQAVEADGIFQREDDREAPLHDAEQLAVLRIERGHAVEHHHGDTGEDHQDQADIEGLGRLGIGFEDPVEQPRAQAARRGLVVTGVRGCRWGALRRAAIFIGRALAFRHAGFLDGRDDAG